MASTKRPTYKVEIKPMTERKRRKSDLVVMWQSLWDTTVLMVLEVRTTVAVLLSIAKQLLFTDEHSELRVWLAKYFTRVPEDFGQSWRNGKLFCILLEKLQPGCFPHADEVDTDFGLRNFCQAFQVLETKFDIVPTVTVEELVTCKHGSQKKLIELLFQLKQKNDDTAYEEVKKSKLPEKNHLKQENAIECSDCIAKGTGLVVGFTGKASNFVVFYAHMSDLDLVVEIKGQSGTFCSERITKRSPKKKQMLDILKPPSWSDETETSSPNSITQQNALADNYISLEYEIQMNQINFIFTPLVKGEHQISILSHGCHVSDSPYRVMIEAAAEIHKNEEVIRLKSALKCANQQEVEDGAHSGTTSGSFRAVQAKEGLGKVIKRRVLRYIVKVDGKDIIVDTDRIENLATSLLKMDYEFQKSPLCRRNSWGFDGDAERKKSVIRQFCIDLSQSGIENSKRQRSNSLTFSPKPKRSFLRSISYEYEDIVSPTKLETVTEGTVSHFQKPDLLNEEDDNVFAFYNESFSPSRTTAKLSEEYSFPVKTLEKVIEEHIFSNESTKQSDVQHFMGNANLSLQLSEIENLHDYETTQPGDPLLNAREFSYKADEHVIKSSSFEIENCIDHTYQDTSEKKPLLRYNSPSILKCDRSFQFTEKLNEQMDHNEHNYNKGITQCIFVKEPICTKSEAPTWHENYKIKESDVPSTEQQMLLDELQDGYSIQETKSSTTHSLKNYTESSLRNQSTEQNLLFISENVNEKVRESKSLEMASDSSKNQNIIKETIHRTENISKLKNESNSFNLNHSIGTQTLSKQDHQADFHSFWPEQNNVYKTYFSLETNHILNKDKIDSFQSFKLPLNKKQLENKLDILNLQSSSEEDSTLYTRLMNTDSKQNNLRTHVDKYNLRGNLILSSKVENIFDGGNIAKNLNTHEKNVAKAEISFPSTFCLADKDNRIEHVIEKLKSPDSISFKTQALVSLSQFNFKHFNPPRPLDLGSPVKAQIKQWEQVTKDKNQRKKSVDSVDMLLPDSVDIKSKVTFWENLNKKLDSKQSRCGNFKKQKKHICISDNMDLEKPVSIKEQEKAMHPETSSEEAERNRNTSIPQSWKSKLSGNDQNQSNILDTTPETKIRERSFSDPGVLETFTPKTQNLCQEYEYELLQNKENEFYSSSKEEISSNNLADDEESSVGVPYSTEDEYIDDEISENASSSYWGDMSILKCLASSEDSSDYKDFLQLLNSDRPSDHCHQTPRIECKVFGIANYFGHVAVKNTFWVMTKGDGQGNLSATVQGFGRHDVTVVKVEYTQKDIYEITYQVMTPGLYLITVRWLDAHINGSPFLCKITF